jgi:hypothetical protein
MTPRVSFNSDSLAQFCRGWQVTELSLFGSLLRVDLVAAGGLRNPFRKREILSMPKVIYAA